MSNNISQFEEVASSLAVKGIVLSPGNDSAVNILVSALREANKPKEGVQERDDFAIPESSYIDGEVVGSTFSKLLDAAATNIAEEINKRLKYTRGTIVSIFKTDAEELIKKVEELKQDYKLGTLVNVNYATMPSLFLDSKFQEFLNLSINRGSGDETYYSFNVSPKTDAEIIDMLSKNPLFNEYGQELIESQENISTILQSAYSLATSGYINSRLSLTARNNLVLMGLSILLSDTLLNYVDPLEDAGVNLTNYNGALINIVHNNALSASGSITLHNSFTSKEYVITEASFVNDGVLSIDANESNVKEVSSLDPTITNEVIYGAAVTIAGTDNKITIKNLIENKDKYLRAWETYSNVKNASISVSLTAAIKDRVIDFLTGSLFNAPQAEIDAFYESRYPGQSTNNEATEDKLALFKTHIETLRPLITQMVNSAKDSDFNNIYELMEPFYIKRFNYVDFGTYIQCYNAAKDTSTDENKIAETATILYLVNYILSEVSVLHPITSQ